MQQFHTSKQLFKSMMKVRRGRRVEKRPQTLRQDRGYIQEASPSPTPPPGGADGGEENTGPGIMGTCVDLAHVSESLTSGDANIRSVFLNYF